MTDRQIGKVATLALGFQGAVGAFMSMARNYGLHLPEHQVKDIVDQWRRANPWAVRFWADLETAAFMAVKNPGVEFPVGRVKYVFTPDLLEGTLFCVLPNGSTIQYPKARIEMTDTPWGDKKPSVTYLKAGLTAAADAKEWPRHALYGGILAENITQATAACLLQEALRECEAVLHCHDEIVLEVPVELAQDSADTLQALMETAPDWAEGLPLKAEPVLMARYGK